MMIRHSAEGPSRLSQPTEGRRASFVGRDRCRHHGEENLVGRGCRADLALVSAEEKVAGLVGRDQSRDRGLCLDARCCGGVDVLRSTAAVRRAKMAPRRGLQTLFPCRLAAQRERQRARLLVALAGHRRGRILGHGVFREAGSRSTLHWTEGPSRSVWGDMCYQCR